jgi:excisionase family DNA binding protein
MSEKLLTVKDVAAWLGVSRAWVYAHAEGRNHPPLPCVRLGGSLRFQRVEVERFIQECSGGRAA